MRIEINLEKVLETIYVVSAMQGYASLPSRNRELLQEDQREGLVPLVYDGFSELLLRLTPRVSDYGYSDSAGNDVMWIELKERYGRNSILADIVSALLARTLAVWVLSVIYEDNEAGGKYAGQVEHGMTLALDSIDNRGGMMPAIASYR